ncbi:hypothetical protein JQ628_33370 [Bradyrhizobium lablabi]|nr:hypothetical protein [Bradyrhizobium lablabi]
MQRAPGIPCALSSEGSNDEARLGCELHREIANTYSLVIVREGGRSSIPEAAVMNREAAAYWIARSSRAMTAVKLFDNRI